MDKTTETLKNHPYCDGLKAWSTNSMVKHVEIHAEDEFLYKVELKDEYIWGLPYSGKFKTKKDVNRALRTVKCR